MTVAVAGGWLSFISPKNLSAGPGYFEGLVEIEPMQRPRGRVHDFFGLMGYDGMLGEAWQNVLVRTCLHNLHNMSSLWFS